MTRRKPLHIWIHRDRTMHSSNHAAAERCSLNRLKSGRGREPFAFETELKRVPRCILCPRPTQIIGILIPQDDADAEMFVRLRNYAPTLPTSQPCLAYGLCNQHPLHQATGKAIDAVFRVLDEQMRQPVLRTMEGRM